jgi:hypothetical protein
MTIGDDHDLIEVSSLGAPYRTWICGRCSAIFYAAISLVHDYAPVSISRVGEHTGPAGPSRL